jgi:hypothetical protein
VAGIKFDAGLNGAKCNFFIYILLLIRWKLKTRIGLGSARLGWARLAFEKCSAIELICLTTAGLGLSRYLAREFGFGIERLDPAFDHVPEDNDHYRRLRVARWKTIKCQC